MAGEDRSTHRPRPVRGVAWRDGAPVLGARRFRDRFDQRTLGTLIGQLGAVPLIVVALFTPDFLIPGGMWGLAGLTVYAVAVLVVTITAGTLTDRQFTVVTGGGMIGVVIAAALVADPGTSHLVLPFLAAGPALAALQSPARTVVGFVVAGSILGLVSVVDRAATIPGQVIGGGAIVIAIFVPAYLVYSLRMSLEAALARQSALSETDPLTRVLNRRGLVTRWDRLAGRSHPVPGLGRAIGFVEADIDFFKNLNDRLGHSAGDTVLIEVAQILQFVTGDRGLVARTGGEEFVIAYAAESAGAFAEFCDEVRHWVGTHTSVTVSIGAVYAPLPADWPRAQHRPAQAVIDELLRIADQEMYAAKRNGRNQVSLTWSDVLTGPAPEQRPGRSV
ncbi:diguanylate cyclase [Gordonia amarae]|uniref:GGDEF domain-containing protein n=2 Tax=Gordonia amarae TaxID=36821 RepID=G7GQY0_9ACTN|nr:GGDEF domain-containing protein [Gordonia amarae]MCS3877576.1 diguanylate cyclase (GGDEF)-like protein [Gordonia amarae]QHN16296.1 diguanylate cyclase [Gordonia amarae]QHN20865.1 diguanylate cyclase [Gordonia amarae]QHN29717.1 diguanylate cyclase [Gordonia amarae]QHN38492.1 diguanylate cyclase [Gordonia amarae]